MTGIIGKKIGMTSVFDEGGNNIVCTIVEAGPCTVTQVKTEESDGYNAIQVGIGERSEKRVSKAMKGHLAKASTGPKRLLTEFRDFDSEAELALGAELRVEDIFEVNDKVHVRGISKGKGFQGVVKRHNFRGVNDATHGQHNRQRAPGSIGQASYPARVMKGLKMAGRTGGDNVKVKNLRVVQIFPENNLVLIEGAVPGAKNGFLRIELA